MTIGKKYESFFMVTKMILRSKVGANSRGDLSIKDLYNQPFVHNSKIHFIDLKGSVFESG
jgi:hypothetical protein